MDTDGDGNDAVSMGDDKVVRLGDGGVEGRQEGPE